MKEIGQSGGLHETLQCFNALQAKDGDVMRCIMAVRLRVGNDVKSNRRGKNHIPSQSSV